jgi:hypothetical protein
VEEMLGERVVGHVLGDEQPLVTLRTASDEVDEALVPHLPHSGRLRLQQHIASHCEIRKGIKPNGAGKQSTGAVRGTAAGRARRGARSA